MSIAKSLLPEFDREMSVTRTLLQRVPEARSEWKPHEKSYTLGDLATHVSNLPSWIPFIAGAEEFDAAVSFKRPPKFSTTAALLEFFDGNVAAGRKALTSIDDQQMAQSWTFKRGDQTIFTRPRADVLRSFVLSHLIHHRGQLSVYLRLQNVPLPNMYGPTADER